MTTGWNGWLVVPLLAIVAVGALIWKKRRRTYHKVGSVSKLLFFPMKSIQGIEVKEGKCTNLGFEVNGLLDRSFMLINDEKKVYINLNEAPKLALLTPKFSGQNLIISGPNVSPLTIKLEDAPNPKAEIIECQLIGELAYVVDCGEESNHWFRDYLNMPNIRLVRHFPNLPKRKFVQNHPLYKSLRKKYTVALQNLAAFHVLSQASINDLNDRLEKKISIYNFRPNILVDGCEPYAEDSWKCIKFGNEVEILNATPSTRCLLTTYDPDIGHVTQKEPLKTLRKYRIPADKEMRKKLGPRACLGVLCFALKEGTIKVNDDVFANFD
ncbi:mitochondrial amidoxime-reducing component 1 [Parasteatoda tepidariorum]|uniref:mitochondrial amidoxime-reducing component 1 n=1 Tax=Parasteatoda tepidariorum TaxID=114398 RepID=UPI0039BC5615